MVTRALLVSFAAYITGVVETRRLHSLRLHLYRVNFEVNDLKPFPHLAFPHSKGPKTPPKLPNFDGELMASFSDLARPQSANWMTILMILGPFALAATNLRLSFARTTKRRTRPTTAQFQARPRLHCLTLAQALGFGPEQRLPLHLHQRKLRPAFAHSYGRNASHWVNQHHTLYRSSHHSADDMGL